MVWNQTIKLFVKGFLHEFAVIKDGIVTKINFAGVIARRYPEGYVPNLDFNWFSETLVKTHDSRFLGAPYKVAINEVLDITSLQFFKRPCCKKYVSTNLRTTGS